MHDAFKKIDKKQANQIIDLINPHLDGGPFNPDHTDVMAQNISFYPGFSLVEVAQYTVNPPRKIQALYKAKSNDNILNILDWTNAPIYEVNKIAPIKLSEKNIRDYVRFFFHSVRGRHGRFLIVETVDDIKWQEEPPPSARKAVSKMIAPIKILGCAEDGSYQLQLCMVFKDSLFKADVTVSLSGEVDIHDEELIIEEMPIFDDTLGQ